MLTDAHREELEVRGYTVVADVIPHDECDLYIKQYRQWLAQFKQDEWVPMSRNSLINTCNAGHLEPTWAVRLKAKDVFSQLWKTSKLLTSFDAIAVGRPPEDGHERFHQAGEHWLHVDQNASRVGLHAYQGAIYLEEQCEDDWTIHVMDGTHKHLQEFYDTHPAAACDSEVHVFYGFKRNETHFFQKKGCEIKRVPVSKGGMILWDSRLIHANARPLEGRQHPGRWRFTVFVSMTPAIWASKEDMDKKKAAYSLAHMTTHWSSEGVKTYKSVKPFDAECPDSIPDIGQTMEAKLLSGVIPYDFNDGEPTGVELRPLVGNVNPY